MTETAAIVEQARAGFAERVSQQVARMTAAAAPPSAAPAGTQVVHVKPSNVAPTGTPEERAELDRQVLAASLETGESTTRGTVATPAERVTYAHAVMKHVDADGYVDSHILGARGVLSHGYGLPHGLKLHAVTAYQMLEVARAIDLPQVYVTRWLQLTEGKPK